MEALSRELRTWLVDAESGEEPELDDLIAQSRHTHQDDFDDQAARESWLKRFEELVLSVEDTTITWVSRTLEQAGLRPEVSLWHDHNAWVERTRFLGMQPQLASEQRWVTAEFGGVHWPTKIAVGVGLDVDLQGEFWCAAHVAWGDMKTTATRQLAIGERVAPLESIEVEALLAALHREVQSSSKEMLRDLAARRSQSQP
jgi:hypothetical protein